MDAVKALCAGAVAVVVLTGSPPSAAPANVPPPAPPGIPCPDLAGRVILVTGHGTVEAPADRVTITLGAQTTRPTAQDAQERTSTTMNQIIRQITALGIPRDRMRTVELNLFPERKPPSGEISGYQAVQRIAVIVDDLSLAGRVIDAGVTAGANLLDAATFGLRDPAAYRAQALAAAIQDARATAAAAATAAGVTLLRVVRIEEAQPGVVPRLAFQAPADATTPILAGTLSVTVQVRVAFAF